LKQFDVPVLFVVFNRLDTVKEVLNGIKKVKPTKLYVGADGPRNKEEKKKTDEVRKYILETVDWDCEIKTLFRKNNLGCAKAVSGAIDWLFENEYFGVILEDDCYPDETFFYFCKKLLKKYKKNDKVMHISGTNYQYNGGVKVKESYYFSKYVHVWGWATWKRAWKKFDLNMNDWPKIKNSKKFLENFSSNEEKVLLKGWFQNSYNDKNRSWAVPWMYSLMKNEGISIKPAKNLIKNIGFSGEATHTEGTRLYILKTPLESIKKINHPKLIKTNTNADEFTFKREFSRKSLILKIYDLAPNNLKKSFKKIYNKLIRLY
jgi:hypothetical protein